MDRTVIVVVAAHCRLPKSIGNAKSKCAQNESRNEKKEIKRIVSIFATNHKKEEEIVDLLATIME